MDQGNAVLMFFMMVTTSCAKTDLFTLAGIAYILRSNNEKFGHPLLYKIWDFSDRKKLANNPFKGSIPWARCASGNSMRPDFWISYFQAFIIVSCDIFSNIHIWSKESIKDISGFRFQAFAF